MLSRASLAPIDAGTAQTIVVRLVKTGSCAGGTSTKIGGGGEGTPSNGSVWCSSQLAHDESLAAAGTTSGGGGDGGSGLRIH